MRCGSCGNKELGQKDQKGRLFPWRDYKGVPLRVSLFLIECLACQEGMIRGGDCKILDSAIEMSILIDLKKALGVLKMRSSDQEVAESLNISLVELDNLTTTDKAPAFALFSRIQSLSLRNT